MSKDKKNINCSSSKFKRLNYYEGMLLTEQDFKDEQNYFREKMKLHNRLHGYGVVWGLEIIQKSHKEDNNCIDIFYIEPGFALDCAGNEIIICHPHTLPINKEIKEYLQVCPPLTEKICLSVSIKYCESKTEPQPQYSSGCEDDELQIKMSRICEGYSVELLPKKKPEDGCKQHPGQDCNCKKTYRQDCEGVKDCCEEEFGIVLGCICIDPPVDEGVSNSDQAEKGKANNSLQVYIDTCCKPPMICRRCVTPQEKWEYHKQNFLQELCKSTESVNLANLIGKPKDEAESYLNEIGFSDPTIYTFPEVPPSLFPLLQFVSSCVYSGTEITLIIDKGGCVLFAFSFPSFEGGNTVFSNMLGGRNE